MRFKTYGSMLDSLKPALALASAKVYAEYYSTPSYFRELGLAVHRAYENWCETHGIPVQERADLRDAIRRNIQGSQHHIHGGLRQLCDFMPAEFAVRGTWTSEQA